jgi:hypothetical protein
VVRREGSKRDHSKDEVNVVALRFSDGHHNAIFARPGGSRLLRSVAASLAMAPKMSYGLQQKGATVHSEQLEGSQPRKSPTKWLHLLRMTSGKGDLNYASEKIGLSVETLARSRCIRQSQRKFNHPNKRHRSSDEDHHSAGNSRRNDWFTDQARLCPRTICAAALRAHLSTCCCRRPGLRSTISSSTLSRSSYGVSSIRSEQPAPFKIFNNVPG